MTTMMHAGAPRRVNINAIGRTSSGRLVKTLSAMLADKIIGVRERGGDFGSFEDMRTRVDGLGPVKITALKEAGFVIEATRHREHQDLYTKQRRRVVETLTPEVDHVWECQIINFVNSQVVADNPDIPAYRTRAIQKILPIVMNGVENLNVTTHEVNQKKKGPYSRWIHRHKDGNTQGKSLEEHARESCPGLVDSGVWANITCGVVKVWDELDGVKGDILNPRQREHMSKILEEMKTLMAKMEE